MDRYDANPPLLDRMCRVRGHPFNTDPQPCDRRDHILGAPRTQTFSFGKFGSTGESSKVMSDLARGTQAQRFLHLPGLLNGFGNCSKASSSLTTWCRSSRSEAREC